MPSWVKPARSHPERGFDAVVGSRQGAAGTAVVAIEKRRIGMGHALSHRFHPLGSDRRDDPQEAGRRNEKNFAADRHVHILALVPHACFGTLSSSRMQTR